MMKSIAIVQLVILLSRQLKYIISGEIFQDDCRAPPCLGVAGDVRQTDRPDRRNTQATRIGVWYACCLQDRSEIPTAARCKLLFWAVISWMVFLSYKAVQGRYGADRSLGVVLLMDVPVTTILLRVRQIRDGMGCLVHIP